jgi:ribonuclease HII
MGRRWRDRALIGGVVTAGPLLPPGAMVTLPTLAIEQRLLAAGYRSIAGVDEVGRGALAGPLVAAAVVLPLTPEAGSAGRLEQVLAGVQDSKLLTPEQRRHWAMVIHATAHGVGLAWVPPAVIDAIGVGPANRLALRLAVANLSQAPDHALLDAVLVPELSCDQTALVGGDRRSLSIAAASILAKVARDDLLTRLGQRLPAYGFARHKGYGTAEHLAALARHGPCGQHRRSFAPVRGLVAGLLPASFA